MTDYYSHIVDLKGHLLDLKLIADHLEMRNLLSEADDDEGVGRGRDTGMEVDMGITLVADKDNTLVVEVVGANPLGPNTDVEDYCHHRERLQVEEDSMEDRGTGHHTDYGVASWQGGILRVGCSHWLHCY